MSRTDNEHYWDLFQSFFSSLKAVPTKNLEGAATEAVSLANVVFDMAERGVTNADIERSEAVKAWEEYSRQKGMFGLTSAEKTPVQVDEMTPRDALDYIYDNLDSLVTWLENRKPFG